MEFRHLRYFLAVADTLHFRRAADSLHVSQPALSQQIKQLEQQVGTRLFDRMGRKVQMTRAGTIFREHAQRVLREMESAQAAIDEHEGLERGTLAAGVVQTVNAYLIPDIVSCFSEAHPQVLLKIEELSGYEVVERVTEGRLDMGIGFIPTMSDRIESELLFEEDLVLIAPRRHRLATRHRISIVELAREPLVLLSQKFCARRLIDDSFRIAGVQPTVAIEMNSIEGILATIRTSQRATILPRLSLGKRPVVRLSAVTLINPTPQQRIGLLWRKGGHRSPAARAFAEQAKAVTKEYWL